MAAIERHPPPGGGKASGVVDDDASHGSAHPDGDQRLVERIVDASATGVVVTDDEGVIVLANDAAAQILRRSKEALRGCALEHLVTAHSRRHVEEVLAVRRRGGVGETEVELEPNAGELVWARLQASSYLDDLAESPGLMTIIMVDVTERHRLIERLETLVRQFTEAQTAAHIGTWEWDLSTGEVHWSDELYRIYGLQPQSRRIDFRTFLSFVHREDRSFVAGVLERASSEHTPFHFVHRVVRPSGEVRTIAAAGAAITDADGKALRMVGTGHDVTSELRLRERERHYAAAYAREQEATRRLRELDALRDAFLAAISHELRTPLTSILGFAVTLQERGDDLPREIVHSCLDSIVDQSRRLEVLLQDLLDVDRMRRGILGADRREIDLMELVHRTVRQVPTWGHPVTVQGPTRLRAYVDTAKVERIVENLVGNAVKHSPPGTPVRVAVWREGTGVMIVVEDRGPGVPREAREEVFEPFRRLPGKVDAKGTGLGLAVVRSFAQVHGGRAWVEDAAGGTGAAFHVFLVDRLPRRVMEGTDRRAAESAASYTIHGM